MSFTRRLARLRVPLGFVFAVVVMWLATPTWPTLAWGLPIAALGEALRIWAKPAQEMLFGHEYIAPEALRMLLFGSAMVLIMLYRPHGLWPVPKHGVRPAGAVVPPPAGPTTASSPLSGA